MSDGLSLPSPATLVTAAGPKAAERFVEFFTATIRNRNTRRAYANAIGPFLSWCAWRDVSLEQISPVLVAAYVEKLLAEGLAKPSVKQHLAAIRMLFDYLVTGGVLPTNPAASVAVPGTASVRARPPFFRPRRCMSCSPRSTPLPCSACGTER